MRAQFALDPDVHHFDAFLFAPHPRPVREAIERHRRGLDAGANVDLREHQESLDRAVADAAAGYLGVDAEQLALRRGR